MIYATRKVISVKNTENRCSSELSFLEHSKVQFLNYQDHSEIYSGIRNDKKDGEKSEMKSKCFELRFICAERKNRLCGSTEIRVRLNGAAVIQGIKELLSRSCKQASYFN
jgi:predicted adenine nucleotide alpha hydrolase (AANH) superfamily ATPase